MRRGLLGRLGGVCVLLLALWGASSVRAQIPSELNVMPLPTHVQVTGGVLKIDEGFTLSFSGYREARLDRAAQRFVTQMARQTGIPFRASVVAKDPSKATLLIRSGRQHSRRAALSVARADD